MHEAQIAPPSPPSPPQLPVITDAQAVELIQPPAVAGTNASPSDVLQAYQAQRDELRSQLNSLTSERYSIARRLREGEVSGVDKAGLESRMQALDTRILDVSKSVAAADLRVATQKGVPGANVPPPFSEQGPPRQVLEMGFVLALVLFVPSSLAIARRIWRRASHGATPAAVSREMDERLSRLEQAMDAVAVEVERVGEGQRYVTRILGAGAAQPISARAAERIEVPR